MQELINEASEGASTNPRPEDASVVERSEQLNSDAHSEVATEQPKELQASVGRSHST